MNFDELLSALDQLSGQEAEAEIVGVGDGSSIAHLVGELRHMEHFAPDEFPELVDAAAETAETFVVGGAHLTLWPSRFVRAHRIPNTRGWLELTTKDAVIQIGPKSVPWLD